MLKFTDKTIDDIESMERVGILEAGPSVSFAGYTRKNFYKVKEYAGRYGRGFAVIWHVDRSNSFGTYYLYKNKENDKKAPTGRI